MNDAEAVLARLASLPPGASEVTYQGRRYSLTNTASPDGRRRWLYAEQRGGPDRISCNIYRLAEGPILRPCEMPLAKVVHFVLHLEP